MARTKVYPRRREPKAGRYKNGRRVPTRFRPGVVAAREVRFYQRGTELLLPRAPFARLVREVTRLVSGDDDFRFQSPAMAALQTAAEALLIGLLNDAGYCAEHAGRKTVNERDLALAKRLRGALR